MKRSSWRKCSLERRKGKVESGFLLCNVSATNLGVYPPFENLPAGERDGPVVGWIGVDLGVLREAMDSLPS